MTKPTRENMYQVAGPSPPGGGGGQGFGDTPHYRSSVNEVPTLKKIWGCTLPKSSSKTKDFLILKIAMLVVFTTQIFAKNASFDSKIQRI